MKKIKGSNCMTMNTTVCSNEDYFKAVNLTKHLHDDFQGY